MRAARGPPSQLSHQNLSAKIPQTFQQSNLASQTFSLIFFKLHGFKLTQKTHRTNLLMGLCANMFTLVHSSFEKSMENLLSPGFSCSAPNLVSDKFRNGLKIIKLQNQYLNKKVLSSS